jgi:hypothetical protein
MEREVPVDHGKAGRHHRAGRERSADTLVPPFIFNSEARYSKEQLRQPDRSDDEGRPAWASI